VKGLVIGGGSIGTRHIQNLRLLGIGPLTLVEPDEERRAVLCDDDTIVGFDTLEKGLEWKPDFAVIATPSHLHITQAVEVAKAGCHLFIEKPLSHTAEGLERLLKEVVSRRLVSLVGCNMRFHPGPARVKELIRQESIGRVLFARIHTGSYLPDWRPGQDYRKSYSSNAAMGGGCILDCIHEIDLARWYLGDVEDVFCVANHLSSLEVDVEDVAILICRHKNGSLSEIHLDYVQRTYERGCQIVGETGSILWDYRDGVVRYYDAEQDRWMDFPQPESWDVNQIYLDEMKHFIDCVNMGKATILPVPEAIEVIRIALAAKISVSSERFVPTRSVVS
jgi:predicted dehydrogenase